MDQKSSPYLPIPTDPTIASTLIAIKLASERYECSADTLKNNTKSRQLVGYQQRFGMPVFVHPHDVEQFLKARPDINSVFRSKEVATTDDAEAELPAPWNVGGASSTAPNYSFPVFAGPPARAFGELGMVRLKSLDNATPGEVALVASCLAEISGILNRSAPAGSLNLQSEIEEP